MQARQPADEVGLAFVRKTGEVAPFVGDDERPLERKEIARHERLQKKWIGHPSHGGGPEIPVEQRAPGPAGDGGRGDTRVARRGGKGVGERRVHIGPPGSVRGIVFKNEAGEPVHTAERPKINDLDSLPFPDREAIDHQKYLDAWKTHHGASSINLITARGCPYRCTWCSHAVYGYSHRRRSPENVAAEVTSIVERYNPDQLWYADDVFTISHLGEFYFISNHTFSSGLPA